MSRKDSKGRKLKDGERERSDGRYEYRYTDRFGKRRSFCSQTLADLRAKELELQRDLSDGITITSDKLTINDVFDVYIQTKTDLKPSTYANYLYQYNHVVRDEFGKLKIKTVKYSDVLLFYKSLMTKGYKPYSIDNIHTIIHPVFTMAVRDGFLRYNPSDGAMAEIKKLNKGESKDKRHALTREEQDAFMNFIKNDPTYRKWLPIITFLLGTGCRIGETIGIRWDDIDFENNVISINHELIYRQHENGDCKFYISTPKTDAGIRDIPLLPDVKRILKEERLKCFSRGFKTPVIDEYTNFVFLNERGHTHIPNAVNRAIKRAYSEYNKIEEEQAKLEHRKPMLIRHFSVHNLRHTFCTRYCEIENNVKVIQHVMGHADIETTMNIYTDVTKDMKKKTYDNLKCNMIIG